MREKKGGALQKLKKRLSHSFGRLCKLQFLSNNCKKKIINTIWFIIKNKLLIKVEKYSLLKTEILCNLSI